MVSNLFLVSTDVNSEGVTVGAGSACWDLTRAVQQSSGALIDFGHGLQRISLSPLLLLLCFRNTNPDTLSLSHKQTNTQILS